MSSQVVERRVRESYPALLMMLVSLIVALVFENLLLAGFVAAAAAVALYAQLAGLFVAGLLLVLASCIVIVAHVRWYREWKAATGLSSHHR